MTTLLRAESVWAGVEHYAVVVGFADDPLNPSQYLLFQCGLDEYEQDQQLGMDQVYVECCDQSRGAYGGVEQVVLRNGSATVSLSPQTAMQLGTDRQIEISFPQDSDRLQAAKGILQHMLSTAFRFEA